MPEDRLLFITTGIKKTFVWKTRFVCECLDTVQQGPSLLENFGETNFV